MSADVTVIVPVWNRRDLLERFLTGLQSQTQAIAEVIAIDDGSEDGSAELALELGVRTIRMGAHGGFAKAVNRGICECRTQLLAIVNNDVELAPDWLERLSAALAPGVWFATGKILQANTSDFIDGTYDALCRGAASWRVGNARRDGPLFREAREIWSAPMTAALFRAELFERAGLLDERFESYLEDVEFGLRCAQAKCPGRYVPDAVAWHQGSATLGAWHPDTVRRISRNQMFLVAKHFSSRTLLRYAWPVAVAQGLWGAVALCHGRGWSWLRGKAEGILRFRELRQPVPDRYDWLEALLNESEHEIRRVQRNSFTDFYWSLYFLLTAGGAK